MEKIEEEVVEVELAVEYKSERAFEAFHRILLLEREQALFKIVGNYLIKEDESRGREALLLHHWFSLDEEIFHPSLLLIFHKTWLIQASSKALKIQQANEDAEYEAAILDLQGKALVKAKKEKDESISELHVNLEKAKEDSNAKAEENV
ncbi:hypothetical protein ACJX0J_013342, partial [Zea mays]